nr:MAG TPA: HNH endonuclease bacteriophage, HNH Endonuclease, DNA.52A [Caudoviricetes sp.]
MKRRYSELKKLKTFKERLLYCKTSQFIGETTFGGGRYLNQLLYKSELWKNIRNEIIIRDNGCDLGVEDRPINSKIIIVHHLNPITKEQILTNDSCLYNPENLVCCSLATHNAIHYNNDSNLLIEEIERKPNDTIPWR